MKTEAGYGQLVLWKTQSPAPGVLSNPLRQAINFKNRAFMSTAITQMLTASHTIALPPAATAITVSLVNDTGATSDRITNTPDIKIAVGDSNAIAEILISLDGITWQNVKSQLVNNAVVIDRPKMETLFGKTLDDGSYTVSVRSKDLSGKITSNAFGFGIDTIAPTLEVTGLRDGIAWRSGDRCGDSGCCSVNDGEDFRSCFWHSCDDGADRFKSYSAFYGDVADRAGGE